MTTGPAPPVAPPVELDASRLEATRGPLTVSLTPSQFTVLSALVGARGAVVRREELGHLLWGPSGDRSDNALEVHVSALRRKLDDPLHVRTIVAVYGLGYRLAD
ncbi:MAG: winged helix-turn-helix domain-containing protein [Actinomycetota bacterium]